LAATVVKKSD